VEEGFRYCQHRSPVHDHPPRPKCENYWPKIVMTQDELFDLVIAMEEMKENQDGRCQKLFKQNQSLSNL
jgi:hypothetical protein